MTIEDNEIPSSHVSVNKNVFQTSHFVVCRAQVVRCTWLIRLLLFGTFSLVDLVIGPLPTTFVVFLPPSLLVPLLLLLPLPKTLSKDFCFPGGGGDNTVGLSGIVSAGDSSSTVLSTTTVT